LPAAREFQALVPFILILIAILIARLMNVLCRRLPPPPTNGSDPSSGVPSPAMLMGPADAVMASVALSFVTVIPLACCAA
jgi:hypothetical protein